jgi:hypothetical protein
MVEVNRSPVRIISAGLVFLIISQILHLGGILISIDYYTHPNYYELWSPILISFGNIRTGVDFFYISILFGFIGAFLFVGVFSALVKSLGGSSVSAGVKLGLLVFLVANVPGSLSMFQLLNIPLEIVMLWTLESFLIYLIGGAAVGRIMEARPEKAKEKDEFESSSTQPEWLRKREDKSKKEKKTSLAGKMKTAKADGPKWMKEKPSESKSAKIKKADDNIKVKAASKNDVDGPTWMKQMEAGKVKDKKNDKKK